MKNKISLLLIISSVFILSCTSTYIKSSWHEPGKHITIGQLNKVLVVALLKNETNRRKAEDKMVGYLKGKGVVSYSYLDDNFNRKNEAALMEKIRSDGFDGAVTLRLVDVDKEENYTPATYSTYPRYYHSFGGYYLRSWSYYSTPGYYTTTKKYTVEINVYSMKDDKMIWSALTESTDPGGVDQMLEEITDQVYHKMMKDGFISKSN